ncbi:hypothetical protein I316_01879 [Kwoniella heveanensis BCC8398]|uniref:BZIP domain-containing protein n=1 Tax=Kwoniella heveanensis BCC8398 TaxID=1296120 RepID=A0A1B9H051_9TREE|nr:hypothetical protein I316_01879 [Kwoniella heveanensis BCC8398]
MSDKNKDNDPTMGGLDALVAAASSVAGQSGKNRAAAAARGITMDMIDPALTSGSATNEVADAMSLFLSNPAVVQLIAEYNAKKQHRHVSLYTQLLSGSALPTMNQDTPVQQTRSGRISRPPVYPPVSQLQHLLANSSSAIPSHTAPVSGDTQIQAIKDALENVSASNQADSGHYDALMQAVAEDSSSSSRFWRNNDLANAAWSGIEASTLAQAAEASQRVLGHGLPPTNGDVRGGSNGKRGASAMDSMDDESTDDLDGKRQRIGDGEVLPEWPLPPTGKGGRKNMPREELLARRRARNRVAAQESRKKKKEFFGSIADRLKDREAAYDQLEAHCQRLEKEVEALKKVVLGAGLELPVNLPVTPVSIPLPTPGPSTAAPLIDDTPMSFDVSPTFDSFNDLFTIDDNDADDGDFIPPSSPKRDSESDDSDADDEDVIVTASAKTKRGKKNNNNRSSKDALEHGSDNANGNENDADENETPMAEDVEEDLFLPIEDVPVPPRDEEDQQQVMKQAMTELHVDTPQELMGVIKKMVETAGYGGVTEEQVGMLSKLLALGQAQGMSIW